MGCNIVLRIWFATFLRRPISIFLKRIIGICNNLVCFTHLTIAGRKENIPFFLVLSDKMSRIKINSQIIFKNPFPPSLFPCPCLQPHRSSQSRDQQGHFHPLLDIEKHMLFAAPSQKVRPQMWGCDGERRHKCEFAMHGLVQYTTQRVNIWQLFCNLLTDLQNIEIGVIKRMALTIVLPHYI